MAILDTSFLIDLERNQRAAKEALEWLLAQEEPLLVPAQVAIEYLSGIEDPVQGLHKLNGSFVVVGVGQEQILEASRLGRGALERGHRPGWGDLQVAALARLEGSRVVTADPGPFERLGCAVWNHRTQEPSEG